MGLTCTLSSCDTVTARVETGQVILPRTAPQGSPFIPDIKISGGGGSQQLAAASVEHNKENSSPDESSRQSSLLQVKSYAAQTAEEIRRTSIMNKALPWLAKATAQLPDIQPVAWHMHHQRLAVADTSDCVQLFDVEPPRQAAQAGFSASRQSVATLQHKEQHKVAALEWRPHCRGMLAVAGFGAVCLWNLPRQSSASNNVTSQLRVLRPERPVQLTSLAWSPSGRLLAGAHGDAAGFTVWDVALGMPTTVSTGLNVTSLLRWSPNGSYLLAATPGGSFQIWETEHWTSSLWRASAAGDLVGACWRADSKAVLLAFAGAAQLAALIFIAQAPSLSAQLVPVEMPDFTDRAPKATGKLISSIDWDPSGERLAVACGPDHEFAGQVVLYATVSNPLVSARPLGNIKTGSVSGKGAVVSFHQTYSKGALLAVRSEQDTVRIVPMIFTQAVLVIST